jgi:hypothetical protein
MRSAEGESDVVELADRGATVSDATGCHVRMAAEVFWQSRPHRRRWLTNTRGNLQSTAPPASLPAPTRGFRPSITLYSPIRTPLMD